MGLIAPLALAGLVAAFVPYLVHRRERRTPTPVSFAAMQLLTHAERRVRSRRRLREYLLLIIRTTVAVSLPLIFARPFIETTGESLVGSTEALSAVIVIDNSASMSRRLDGKTLFERAQARARDLVRSMAPGSTLAITSSDEAATPINALVAERQELLLAIDRIQPSVKAAAYTVALQHARTLLATAVNDRRHVFVLTDRQAAGWETDVEGPAESPVVTLVDISEGAPWPNRAVVGLKAMPQTALGPGGLAVTAEIVDFGSSAAEPVGVQLFVDGQSVSHATVELVPNTRVQKRFTHTVPSDSVGVHVLQVALQPTDGFEWDDQRRTSLALGRALRILVINGDPRTEKTEDETFFLLSALESMGSGISVTTRLPDDVDPLGLAAFNAIFIANVRAPSATLAEGLNSFVANGGGVFLSVGDKVDIDIWNQRFSGLLPQPLSLIRTAADQSQSDNSETHDERPAAGLAPLDRAHPLLRRFTADGQGLARSRFYKYMLLKPVEADPDRKVVLRFTDGAPALVEREIDVRGAGAGKTGRVLLLASTIDRDWSDLAIRPGFLPLVVQSARRLSGSSDRPLNAELEVGQSRSFTLQPGQRRLEIEKPDGTTWVAQRKPGTPKKIVRFKDTSSLGVYTVKYADSSNQLHADPNETFVVNLTRVESDPTLLDEQENRWSKRAENTSDRKPMTYQRPLWHLIATVLIALIGLESLVALRRRPPRAA